MSADIIRERNSHIFAREGGDHYAEPVWCGDRLFDVERFEGPTITDPCCGFGHILQSAQKHIHMRSANTQEWMSHPNHAADRGAGTALANARKPFIGMCEGVVELGFIGTDWRAAKPSICATWARLRGLPLPRARSRGRQSLKSCRA